MGKVKGKVVDDANDLTQARPDAEVATKSAKAVESAQDKMKREIERERNARVANVAALV